MVMESAFGVAGRDRKGSERSEYGSALASGCYKGEDQGQINEVGGGVCRGLKGACVGGEVFQRRVVVDELGDVAGIVDLAGPELPGGVELLQGFGR